MNAIERLGRLAAECDIAAAAATKPAERAMFERMAADYRKVQFAALSKYEHENNDQDAYLAALPVRAGWWARLRKWFGGAR